MSTIKETTLHPDNDPNIDLYPKTSTDQVEGLNNIITGVNNEIEGLNNTITGVNNEIEGLNNTITGVNKEIEGLNNIITGINNEVEKKVNTVDNFVRVFTIPNGVSSGTLTADVKQKLCNPDGHNYYVYDDTSQMILKYSFNADDEIIQYKAIYLQTDKAYEITMQILLPNGSWRRSQTVLNAAASQGVTSLNGQTGALTTKTLFGTNSILGTGNIDIYKHVINFTDADGETFFNMIVYSSKSLVVDSLTDLQTLIGDYATENVSGYIYDGASSLYYPVFKVDTTVLEVYYIHQQNGLGSITLSDYTITDTVTTI